MHEELIPPQSAGRRKALRFGALMPAVLAAAACNGDPFPPAGSSTTASTAPTITSQPTNVTVAAGITATFTVAATGTAPLTFQWFRDTVLINGATQATYSFVTSAGDSGSTFTVTVSNSFGSVSSNGATLTIQ